MAPVYLTWFLLLYERIVCYENLCRKPGIYASQSSDRGGFPATNAVDGFYNQKYVFCAHTAPHQSKAWFQVDLGNPYRLNSVNIFYRNDITWRPYRFRQFYLDVSNTSAALSTTLTPQRVRCYKDNTTDEAIPPALIDIPCTQTAQYVIIETTYNAPENPNSGDGPMLEICEIDIYGCSTECFGGSCYSNGECGTCGGGQWGDTCQYNCSSNCYDGNCDKYKGYCNRECNLGFWGYNCTKRCSDHCLNDVCDYYNGSCIMGCKSYFTGIMCQKCSENYYGPRCDQQCSPICLNGTCFPNNGWCKYGINSTFNIDKCIQANNQEFERSTKYFVITILVISLSLNIFFIVRKVRKSIYKRQNSKKVNRRQNSAKDANITIHDKGEDNTGYQELGQLSQPSHYEELK